MNDRRYKNVFGSGLGNNIIQPMGPPPPLFNPADPYGINSPMTQIPITSPANNNTDMSNTSSSACTFGISICNVQSPVCSQQVSDNITAEWDKTLANVDNIIMGVPTIPPAATPGSGSKTPNQQAQAAQATNSAYYVIGAGVILIILAGVVIRKVMSGKHK